MNARVRCAFVSVLSSALLSLFQVLLPRSSVSGQVPADRLIPGVLAIAIDHDILTLPPGMYGLVFDTSMARETAAPFKRLAEGLAVDSTYMWDGVTSVDSANQIAAIDILPSPLWRELGQVPVRELRKLVKDSRPDDTIVVNPITGDTTIVQDQSEMYRITFPATLDLDSLLARLKSLPGVLWVEPAERPVIPIFPAKR